MTSKQYGSVDTVTAGDDTVIVGGTAKDPTVALNPGGSAVGSIITALLASDLTVNNTVAYTTVFSIPVVSGAKYLMDGFSIYHSNTTADIKWAIDGLATGSWWNPLGMPTTATGRSITDVTTIGPGFVGSMGGDGTTTASGFGPAVHFRGILIPNTTPLIVKFSQNTANASDTVVRANTWIRLHRVA